jgi:S-(hydroxymethyl)glutathione dehydrogenase / alcohol dehydrogenase
MKAVMFHKPGEMEVDKVEEPQIKNPQDIILRITATAICGSDLHIEPQDSAKRYYHPSIAH